MGRLPMLTMTPRGDSKQIGSFGGLNKGLVIGENEFSDMKNMSSDVFPAIAVRKPRGEILKSLSKPHGIIYKNGLAYVDGTKLFYKDKEIATVQDTDKQLVSLGAYIVVFPDKIMYNTSTGEKTALEASWSQAATATFAQTTTGSTMVKISCTGIGKQFNQFDGVEISDCTKSSFNKTTVIQEKADDYIVIIGDLSSSFTQESGLKLTRKVPDMDYICENGNRLWGCSSANHEVYASKLGDPTNWNAFEGISTDSYAATVGSDGDYQNGDVYIAQDVYLTQENGENALGVNRSGKYLELPYVAYSALYAKGIQENQKRINKLKEQIKKVRDVKL